MRQRKRKREWEPGKKRGGWSVPLPLAHPAIGPAAAALVLMHDKNSTHFFFPLGAGRLWVAAESVAGRRGEREK